MHGALQRLRDNVASQDWFAVGVNLLLVTFGILLAFQIDRWWEHRSERHRADASIERLAVDLREDLRILEARMEFWQQVEAASLRALEYAETNASSGDSAWARIRDFYHASQVWPFTPIRGTYHELTNSGQLALVRDVELRRRLARYYLEDTQQLDLVFDSRPRYRDLVRMTVPLAVQDYYWRDCHRSSPRGQELLPCPTPMTDAAAAALLARLSTSEDLADALRLWTATQRVGQYIATDMYGASQELVRAIETR